MYKPALYDEKNKLSCEKEKRESKMKKTTMLKKNYEFRNVLTKGKRFRATYIEIYTKRNNLQENKLGIAISSKVANSVNRNRIKRLIRENYRLVEEKINTGYSFVILWNKNKNVEEANFNNIKNDISKFIEKTNLSI